MTERISDEERDFVREERENEICERRARENEGGRVGVNPSHFVF